MFVEQSIEWQNDQKKDRYLELGFGFCYIIGRYIIDYVTSVCSAVSVCGFAVISNEEISII